MIQSLRLSLYDFFGYFLPGMIVTVALFIFAWAVYYPYIPILISAGVSVFWIAGGLLSYFAGHLVQALGNIVSKLIPSPEQTVFGEHAKDGYKALATAARSIVHAWNIETSKL